MSSIAEGQSPRAAALACLLTALSLTACGGAEEQSTPPRPPAEVISARSAPFDRYSGEGPAALALAEFGTEASKADRLAAQARIAAYLRVLEEGRWEAACGYLGRGLTAQIAEAIRRSKPPKPSCGEVLAALIGPRQAKGASAIADRPIASLRIKAGPEAGFALYRGADGRDYWLAVRREGGQWRMLGAVQRFERP